MQETQKIQHIFLPHYAEERARFEAARGRFVYYTSAATAALILKNKEIWLRSSGVMNDYSEVKHGLACLSAAFESPAGQRWAESLEACFPGLHRDLLAQFAEWRPLIEWDTFVVCFSEHDVEKEPHGRLSMWRAYGGEDGVALVVRPDVFFSESTDLAAYTSPVAYMDAGGVQTELDRVATRIREEKEFVQSLGREGAQNSMFHALRFAAICTKHPAFKEEREWRVVACPSLQRSAHVGSSVEVIGGVPQPVLRMPLKAYPGTAMPSTAPVDFVERILIGPGRYPHTTLRALGELLAGCGHPSPYDVIENTNIPLRPNQR